MSTTTLRDILGTRPVISTPETTPLQEVAHVLASHHVGALAVMKNDNFVGILSERDIVFRAVAKGIPIDNMTAKDVMTPDPVTVDIDAPVADTLRAHLGEDFRHLPVTENGALVGIVSYRDIPAEYIVMLERFREMSA